MFSRRTAPAPLSDELFKPHAPVLLGAVVQNCMGLRVKNTFLDAPSGLTPMSMKGYYKPMLTCPADLRKTIALVERLEAMRETPEQASPSASEWLNKGSPVRECQPPALPSDSLASTQLPNASLASTQPATTSWFDSHDSEDDAGDGDEDSEDGSVAGEQFIVNDSPDIPRPPPGALHPSIGSVAHPSGACKRCCFFPRGRCMNGYECEFCHYSHENRKRKNKKNKGRQPLKEMSAAPARMAVGLAAALGEPTLRSSTTFSQMVASTQMASVSTMAAEMQSRQLAAQQQFMTYMSADGRSMAQMMMPFQGSLGGQQVMMCGSIPTHMNMGYSSCQEAQQPGAPSYIGTSYPPAGGQPGALGLTANASTQIHRLPPAMSQGLSMRQDIPTMTMGYDCAPPPPMGSPKLRSAALGRFATNAAAPPPMTSPKVSGFGGQRLSWLG